MATLSSELAAAEVVVAAALPFERAALLRAAPGARRLAGDRFPIWFRDRDGIAIVQMGIGPERAAECAAWVLPAAPRATLLNLGCAGGLAPHLSAETAVIAQSVTFASSAYEVEPAAVAHLVDAAQHAGLEVIVAPMLCVTAPILNAEAKRAVHAETGAFTVDMESGALARAAADHGRVFAAGRVVLDDAMTTLGPDIGAAIQKLPVDRVAAALTRWMLAWIEGGAAPRWGS